MCIRTYRSFLRKKNHEYTKIHKCVYISKRKKQRFSYVSENYKKGKKKNNLTDKIRQNNNFNVVKVVITTKKENVSIRY